MSRRPTMLIKIPVVVLSGHVEERAPGRGGYSIYPWVGRCGAAPHTLTLFKTNISDFPTLFKTEFRFLSYLLVKKYLLVGTSSMLWTGQRISESVSQ